MASRILNRRELRGQAEQAPAPEAAVPDTTLKVVSPEKKAKKTPAKRKPRAKKAPPRLRARWGVFDLGMKQVAIFDYNQRGAAAKKLANLLAKKEDSYFLQMIKEPMLEPAPIESAPGA